MSFSAEDVNEMILTCFKACQKSIALEAGKGYHLFDKVQKKIFDPRLRGDLQSFGIVPHTLPEWAIPIYLKVKNKRFARIMLQPIPYRSDLMDMGPLFKTRGVQVKFYNFKDKQVLCAGVSDSMAFAKAKNEADIYSRYLSVKSIPKIIERISENIYIREFYKGSRVSVCGLDVMKGLIDDLVEVYLSDRVQAVVARDYFQDLTKDIMPELQEEIYAKLQNIVLNNIKHVFLVRVHGDFAAKNIISSVNKTLLIDWERSSCKSCFYDIGNFIFKQSGHDKDLLWKRMWKDSMLEYFIREIEAKLGVSISGQRHALYALFLLERLSLEKELYQEDIKRYKTFQKTWLHNVDIFLSLLDGEA